MDVSVLILICCFANILQITYADSSAEDKDAALLRRIMRKCKHKNKVCGSDLQPYTECEFKRMHINTESSVFLLHRRSCLALREKCKESFEYKEVCCSDGKTYSICQLVQQRHPTRVTIKYKGPCDARQDGDGQEGDGQDGDGEEGGQEGEGNGVTLPPPQPTTNAPRHTTSMLNQNDATSDIPYTDMQTTMMHTDLLVTVDNYNPTTVTERVCDERCPLEFVPVCGTDGTTYPSLCVLNAVACESQPDLDLDHNGECL
ncbi:four-domain proteases inhibitor-like [Anneissia japonica]|uniref:four-domain proteases inhibitor-like n=1 Tax=Anneissia japonica TaxID=1529436 RepID=UPI001425550C|nr:four-domain proteases inhibitor-like [Anneissia japonica]